MRVRMAMQSMGFEDAALIRATPVRMAMACRSGPGQGCLVASGGG